MTLASIHFGPVQFDVPIWLALIPILFAGTLWIGRKSLAGLGSTTRWIALAVRLLVIVLLCAALAEPQWRRESDDVAVTVIMDSSQSVPASLQDDVERYIFEARKRAEDREDLLGLVTAAKDAFVQALPSKLNTSMERQHIGAVDGTNLAAAVRLGLAVAPKTAANRLVIASDGNETNDSIIKSAEAAKALGIPIDVLPLRYKYENEVLVDRIVVPGSAHEGENITVRVVLNATQDTRGQLAILLNGEPIDLDPGSQSTTIAIDLKAGPNVKAVTLPGLRRGPQNFKAIFTPFSRDGQTIGDVMVENNRATGITFVAGEGHVLLLTENQRESQPLAEALLAAGIKLDVMSAAEGPQTLAELNAFEAVILYNQPSYSFSQKQQEDLKQYVHDSGGGLIMVGGPESFGAGGWIGSVLEDALPIKLDPPQKREMPKGALALVIHSVEMPEGVFWGKKVCEAAVRPLSKLDYVGINEYGFGGTQWVHPMSPVGDGTRVRRSIQNLTFGDMPDFTPSLVMAYDALVGVTDAGQRHCIMISDGDPQTPGTDLLDKFVAAKITISTVGCFPHSGGDTSRMEYISKYTKGRHYVVNTQGALAKVPEIFVKEAQTVRRKLIEEGNIVPKMMAVATETMRGISSVPAMRGYVVAAEREGLALVTLKGKEGDPILAQWQYGLGKAVAYTSDASTRWNTDWVAWEGYKAFWEQHVRWVMRPSGSANVRVATETKGDRTLITVEALDSGGERLNFASFRGRLASPDGTGMDVDLKQIGPGRYQGSVVTDQSGSYVMSLRYAAPDESTGSGVIEGSIQAAINRPFADEFRTLEDNTALLEQVAAMTGGRVLSFDPERDNLWSPEGLKMPVALRPIWLAVALAGLGLFLLDVGVRRVRIDLPMMWAGTIALFKRGKVKGSTQLGGLMAAREQARRRIAERGTAGHAAEVAVREAEKVAEATAKKKFEASPEAIRRAPAGPVAMGGKDAKPEPTRTKAVQEQIRGATNAAEGMDRLMKAKKKAREGMDE